MINLPITRDDIDVWRNEEGALFILVGDEVNNFSVSVKGEEATMHAIKQISEMLQRKIIGITEHDFIMKVNDFFMSEKEGVRD